MLSGSAVQAALESKHPALPCDFGHDLAAKRARGAKGPRALGITKQTRGVFRLRSTARLFAQMTEVKVCLFDRLPVGEKLVPYVDLSAARSKLIADGSGKNPHCG
jgi:hypothetical protein